VRPRRRDKQVGGELGVRYILEGSAGKAGNHVRITGQLVDALTGAHLWADRFDGTLEDIFDPQDSVTASAVGAIAPRAYCARSCHSTAKAGCAGGRGFQDLASANARREALQRPSQAQSRLTTKIALRAALTRPSQLIAVDYQTDVRRPTFMCIGATCNKIPPLRSMLLPIKRTECFTSPRSLAIDYSRQEALPI